MSDSNSEHSKWLTGVREALFKLRRAEGAVRMVDTAEEIEVLVADVQRAMYWLPEYTEGPDPEPNPDDADPQPS